MNLNILRIKVEENLMCHSVDYTVSFRTKAAIQCINCVINSVHVFLFLIPLSNYLGGRGKSKGTPNQ